jgi:hypothetical protein
MINLKLTQVQYDTAMKELAQVDGVNLTLNPDGSVSHIHSNLIDADTKYANGIMLVDITAKHGMAKFASEATIQQHLVDMLGALQCSTTPAPVVN